MTVEQDYLPIRVVFWPSQTLVAELQLEDEIGMRGSNRG